MTKEKSGLEELKKDYEPFKLKYKLPDFRQLNEEFDIEKVAEIETDFLLREIRKNIMDKVIAYLRFVEMLLNPSNAPLFFMSLVKGFESQDKRILERIYEKLGHFEIDVIELDCRYSEKEEAEMINKITKEWKTISDDMIALVEVLRRNWCQKSKTDDRGYCG